MEDFLLQRQREQNGKVFLRSKNITNFLQGEDSPPPPEGTEWQGIFYLLEIYSLDEKILLQRQKERYFYAPGKVFPYKEKILLQHQ
jgi:hypothetical protein